MEQWNDPEYARAWATRNAEDNPERKQPLDLLLKILRDFFAASEAPKRVLDLGCGHGVVAARALAELGEVSLVGVDGSAPMLDLARERLAPYAGRFALAQAAFETMTPADLPGAPYGAAFAVQAIHNTDDEGKKRAYASVRETLAPGGLFVLVDRIRLATPGLFGVYRSVWDVLGATFNAQQQEGATLEEHDRLRIARGDQPGSLEQNLLWLREAGFREVTPLYVVGIRAIIAGLA
ncbi:MAG TPA: class I SAM-dependent methyltransferase [Ktedonobacterales bacterium]